MEDDDVIEHVVRLVSAITADFASPCNHKGVTMSIRRKVGRFRVLVAALLLAISTFALPATTQPAHAQQDACTPNPNQPNPLGPWNTLYDDRGVTVCRATDGAGGADAYVQIVDLAAGAKLRLISDAVDPQAPPAGGNLYRKRVAADWFDWIESNVSTPAPGRLFSTSNASFLVDVSGSTTRLSLPGMSTQQFPNFSIQTLTPGWAFEDNDDAAWDADKQGIRIGSPSASTQRVELFNFPTQYGFGDIGTAFDLFESDGPACGIGARCSDGTVAFDPLYQAVDPVAKRTFVGIDATNKVYILNTQAILTVSEAQDVIESFGSVAELQLDGGNSSQVVINYPGGGSDGLTGGRAVPDVLAVYLAP